MMPPGLAQVEVAKSDWRWLAAYDSARNAKPPEDFLAASGKDKKAKAFLRH